MPSHTGAFLITACMQVSSKKSQPGVPHSMMPKVWGPTMSRALSTGGAGTYTLFKHPPTPIVDRMLRKSPSSSPLQSTCPRRQSKHRCRRCAACEHARVRQPRDGRVSLLSSGTPSGLCTGLPTQRLRHWAQEVMHPQPPYLDVVAVIVPPPCLDSDVQSRPALASAG